jgi:hypothetical protein
MIRSVARHCEPPHNWTLPCGDEPHSLNGPVTSRIISTAVFHNEALSSEDTELRGSDRFRSPRISAERRQMFEATRSLTAAAQPPRDGQHQTSPEKSSNRSLIPSASSTVNRESQAVPSRENNPVKKTANFYRATGTYCLTFKDIQMLCARCELTADFE